MMAYIYLFIVYIIYICLWLEEELNGFDLIIREHEEEQIKHTKKKKNAEFLALLACVLCLFLGG